MKKHEVISNLDPRFLKGIAHRGYHNPSDTENGLRAFKNALDNNLAIELDVHLTKDHQLLVCHDSELKRTTGKSGIIEEMTLQQIKDGYRLNDGEEVPSFKEVMTLINEKVPIVIELKVYQKNYVPLSAQLMVELKGIKDKKNFMLISFDPRALIPFKNSGFMRSLLVCKSHFWTYSLRHLFESVDLEYVLFEKKRVRNYVKKHLVNVWTVQSQEVLASVLPYIDTATFQNMDFSLVRKPLEEKNGKAD